MAALDRIRRRLSRGRQPAERAAAPAPATPAEEARLWAVLREDPNDVQSFHALAEIVRRRAEEGHRGGDPRKAADDAVWALAEELAHSGRAWYPLIELGRLSLHDDRDQALRRLATASDRDPSGVALATAAKMLRDEGRPDDALGLGVGHWRPRDHDVEVGRQLVRAAVEARRPGEARRMLDTCRPTRTPRRWWPHGPSSSPSLRRPSETARPARRAARSQSSTSASASSSATADPRPSG